MILRYSKNRKAITAKITNVVEPTALAVDNQGRLLADNGPRLSQVLIYHIRQRPKLVGTVGTALFRHTREESDSEILRAHRSWGRLFWEYLRKF